MFVGTYLGQLVHSRWYLVPALLIGVTAAANITAPRRAWTWLLPMDGRGEPRHPDATMQGWRWLRSSKSSWS